MATIASVFLADILAIFWFQNSLGHFSKNWAKFFYSSGHSVWQLASVHGSLFWSQLGNHSQAVVNQVYCEPTPT
jgi:hypothetical protein